jgi:hypothetical protein
MLTAAEAAAVPGAPAVPGSVPIRGGSAVLACAFRDLPGVLKASGRYSNIVCHSADPVLTAVPVGGLSASWWVGSSGLPAWVAWIVSAPYLPGVLLCGSREAACLAVASVFGLTTEAGRKIYGVNWATVAAVLSLLRDTAVEYRPDYVVVPEPLPETAPAAGGVS